MKLQSLGAMAASVALGLTLAVDVHGESAAQCEPTKPCAIAINSGDLQAAFDAAPPFAMLVADRAHEFVIDKTILITKPVTIVGLRARLRENLPRTPLMEVISEGFTARDFTLVGNIATVDYEDRASLIVIRRGNFVIEKGQFLDSAKDGVMVTPVEGGGDIEHGVIRDVIGRNNARDVISIAGLGELGLFVRHILVENVRCYDSRDRGAAEASDGSEFITFRDIFSDSSFYGIDIQDHNRKGQVNRNIVIDGLHVRNCQTAIRTANHDFGHKGLYIRNVVGESFRGKSQWRPLHIRNTTDVQVENVRILDNADGPAVHFSNVWGIVVRDLFVSKTGGVPEAIHVENVDDAVFDNLVLDGTESPPAVGIAYTITDDRVYRSLRVLNSSLAGATSAGIVLECGAEKGPLDSLILRDVTGKRRIDLKARIQLVDAEIY